MTVKSGATGGQPSSKNQGLTEKDIRDTFGMPAKREPAPLPAVVDAGIVPESDDLLIPRILLMQFTSEAVKEQKAKAGEFRDSVDGELLEQPIELILFDMFKNWRVSQQSGNKFVRFEEFTADNAHADLEFMEQGVPLKRYKTWNFYALRPGFQIPYLISMSSTAANTAKRTLTMFARMGAVGKPSFSIVCNVTSEKRDNEKGTFFVPTITQGRDCTPEEVEEAKSAFFKIRGSNVVVAAAEDDIPF